jgi:hypothetical protein
VGNITDSLDHKYMREEQSEEGWGLKPCPSCEGTGTKYVRSRRETVAMRGGEQDAQPVQAADECLLCAGTGSVEFRDPSNEDAVHSTWSTDEKNSVADTR